MNTSNKNVLIVDDDEDYLLQMKIAIQSFGFNVITAESQREAEELLLQVKPDLAIFDLMMENEDSGFILSYKLKKRYPDVPVIIATAVASETGISFGVDSEEERRWIKADLYMEKGIRPDQFHREIVKLLKL